MLIPVKTKAVPAIVDIKAKGSKTNHALLFKKAKGCTSSVVTSSTLDSLVFGFTLAVSGEAAFLLSVVSCVIMLKPLSRLLLVY